MFGNDATPTASVAATSTLPPIAAITPLAVPSPSALPPTEAPPVVTGTSGCSWSAQYVADVTIPDNTELPPGTTFVKTWRAKNKGTCDWGSGFQLIFAEGNAMSGPASGGLPATRAGSTVAVSVSLTAPTAPGNYKGSWRIQASDGAVFGGLTVVIVVLSPTPQATFAFPTPTIKDIQAAYQPFQNGFMIWLGDRKRIWVAICCTSTEPKQGKWLTFDDTYADDVPESDPSITPPSGLYQPIRGFGLVWRTQADFSGNSMRDLLGWATAPERGYTAHVEYYPGGYFDPGGGFNARPGNWQINTPDGKVYNFHEAGPAWSLANP